MSELNLQPGDVLLYRTHSVIGWLIRTKTWSPVNHTETYLGDGKTAASRDGLGVATYDLFNDSKHELYAVLRPRDPFDLAAGLTWHESCIGQKYDLKGVFAFFLAAYQSAQDRSFCSEHSVRMARMMGLQPFAADYDADRVSPGMFLASTAYTLVYKAPQ